MIEYYTIKADVQLDLQREKLILRLWDERQVYKPRFPEVATSLASGSGCLEQGVTFLCFYLS